MCSVLRGAANGFGGMRKPMIEELELQPIPGAQEKLADSENQFPDEQPSRIFTNSVKITCEGKLKALFLKPGDNLAPISQSHYKPVLKTFDDRNRLVWRPSKISGRPMVKQQHIGGDLTLGFLPPRSGRREDYFRANNRDQLFFALPLVPLVNDLEAAMRKHLPAYYDFHMYQASKLVRPPDEVLVKNPWKVGDPFQREQLEKLEKSGWAHFHGNKAFSTLTLNKNILFGAHADSHNMPYTLSCLTALGDFVGANLCFPRLGIGFDVQPYDVLISDTNEEFHSSSRSFFGNRYTIVAYLHSRLDRGWRLKQDKEGKVSGLIQNKAWIGSIDGWMKVVQKGEWLWEEKTHWERSRTRPKQLAPVSPYSYTPNFLTKEEANELVSYFETLKFHVRPNPRNPENPKYNIKRQSLGYIASNAFNDRDQKEWRTEYADIDIAPEILQRFRAKLSAHVGKDVNYMSILKYPDGNAHIDWHQHGEDRWHDSPVWDVSVGPTERMFWAREIDNPETTKIGVLAEVGSLITLPASMNTTHQHAIRKDKTTSVRYSINCKSLPLTGVWDCHAGKRYPADAVYVGCRVLGRDGKVIWEGTPFGNGTNPLVSHDGALKTEAEFREYAERKMQDPDFRANVQALRGKHLLCWCVQKGPKRAEFCHARVWLEIANRK
jgi:hypothetical protein